MSGSIPPGMLDRVAEAYRRDYVPIASARAGLDRFVVAARPLSGGGHGIAVMSLWASVEAAHEAFGGDLASPSTLDGLTHGETLTRVDYYEVDDDAARRTAGTPTRLRLTAGTVARGLDADIQQELRRRLAELPPEAVEAFVGRRVLGPDVEIALVTTWSAAPEGVALDAPLWPSISNRYDRFRIEVHDIILGGVGPG